LYVAKLRNNFESYKDFDKKGSLGNSCVCLEVLILFVNQAVVDSIPRILPDIWECHSGASGILFPDMRNNIPHIGDLNSQVLGIVALMLRYCKKHFVR